MHVKTLWLRYTLQVVRFHSSGASFYTLIVYSIFIALLLGVFIMVGCLVVNVLHYFCVASCHHIMTKTWKFHRKNSTSKCEIHVFVTLFVIHKQRPHSPSFVNLKLWFFPLSNHWKALAMVGLRSTPDFFIVYTEISSSVIDKNHNNINLLYNNILPV